MDISDDDGGSAAPEHTAHKPWQVPDHAAFYEDEEELMDEVDDATILKEEAPSFLDPNEVEEEILLDDNGPAPESDSDDDEPFFEEEPEKPEESNMDVEPVEDQSKAVWKGHTGEVYCVSASSGSPSIVVTGSGDDSAIMWLLDPADPANSAQIQLKGHTDTVTHCAFAFNDSLIATAGMDATIRIWNGTTGELVEVLEGPIDSIETLTWHPRGLALFAGDVEGTGWMWSLAGYPKKKKAAFMNGFYGHSDSITTSAFSQDGKKLITASADASLRIWDPVSAQSTAVVNQSINGPVKWHSGAITCLQTSEAGTIATGSVDGLVCITQVSTGKLLSALEGHTDGIESLLFLPSLSWLASASLDRTVIVWELKSMKQRATLQHQSSVVRIIRDRSLEYILYTCTLDGTVYMWDARSGEKLGSWSGHSDQVMDLAVSPPDAAGKRFLFSASDDKTCRVWEVTELC